jgi:hypothetical protein
VQTSSLSGSQRRYDWKRDPNSLVHKTAFQTAVALAEYDAEKDEDGKIVLTDDHLTAVVDLSKDFDDYLSQVHKKDQAGRAAIRHERAETMHSQDDL